MSEAFVYEKGIGAYSAYLSVQDQARGDRWGYCLRVRVKQNGKRWRCQSYLHRKQEGFGHTRNEAMHDALRKPESA